jgi:DNA primase
LARDWETLTTQIKEANDIVDVVGGYVTLLPAGGKFKGLCPFHDDHRPSFLVDPKWQNYRCWACGKFGDVFTFIQEKERVDFREARELLARRAGISLEKTADSPQNLGRALMLDVMHWAEELYQRFLLEASQADAARRYLEERGLSAETIRRFGLGFAPPAGDWLVQQAARAKVATDTLEKVGLIAQSDEGRGFYNRFRDRIMFPIRNTRGQTVGFGGRILPSSPFKDKAPKYYNSADTPLFTKSDQLYGLDQARQAGSAAGYLAVVEGYTDVLMAHQLGVTQVVATLGTALNARHVHHLRRFAPRVVLVFDADAGGKGGVDRALELFVSQDVELAIATLPEGLDPCDLLVQQGAEPFKQALAGAMDALDFKLNQLLAGPAPGRDSIEGRRRAVESLLSVIALAPEMAGQAGRLKRELVIGRIAQRLALKEETLWAWLRERRENVAARERRSAPASDAAGAPTLSPSHAPTDGPAAPHEKELLEVLLAEPALVPAASVEIQPDQIEHLGLRKLLQGLYDLQEAGEPADLDHLRAKIDSPRLSEYAFKMQAVGRMNENPAGWLQELLVEFRKRQQLPLKQELHDQLHAVADDAAALALLRQVQEHGNARV